MIADILKTAEQKMQSAVAHTVEEFGAIRTGRAHPAMFSKLNADYYGTPTPIQQLATFQVPEARVVLISPFDRSSMKAIEKAIRDSDLGVNPADDGNVIRLVMPQLTEERRKEYIKVARHKAEEARIAIRNTRRHSVDAIKKAHLAVGRMSETYSETSKRGTVLTASYQPGTKLKSGTAVDLTVSRGPQPINITDYTGKSTAAAVKFLKNAGFKVKVTSQHSDSIDKGLVISQSPKSGTGVKGDTITVQRSLGPVMVTVPSVRGQGVEAAKKAMTKAGFKTKVQPVAVNYLGLGYVVYTKPGANSSAPKGSTITLYVV